MKFKTTKKAIMNGYTNVISVGYCDLQHLLSNNYPIAYYANAYGWRDNIYQINHNTAIVTGYKPFGNIEPDYEIVMKYDKKAREYISAGKREKLEQLIKKFVNEVIK